MLTHVQKVLKIEMSHHDIVVGIDEVGRGCWAGPVVSGAVVLGEHIAGLGDSKKINKRRRESLDSLIREHALAYGLGWASPEEVDDLGLTKAVRLSMYRALQGITIAYDGIVIDGSINFLAGYAELEHVHIQAIVRADDCIAAVSAASILAKVARDTYMQQAAHEYPAYGFNTHVGYGTAAHIQALDEHGVCPLHRLSYKPVRQRMQAGKS